ncbi:hypothetical protein J7F03_35225 [Streptomyces sp. ISL-43]|uniref:hypothetical protein n=1 Tax=Streptomyces sp. ISL-43 TaxID=2819183 RepID=UPI001BE9CD4C|nr:hypothetical protein [Streptomyces sp. ISL-43]MBT2452220.1 hypothetical protein [Streptomyces sp. ISL-43]
MPGQRKRKRSRERDHRRAADLPPGRWEPLFSTEDYAAYGTYVRRLRAEGSVVDPARLRLDTLCGRLSQPTTYQVSVFVPETVEAAL